MGFGWWVDLDDAGDKRRWKVYHDDGTCITGLSEVEAFTRAQEFSWKAARKKRRIPA
jgi:hypothetical protein